MTPFTPAVPTTMQTRISRPFLPVIACLLAAVAGSPAACAADADLKPWPAKLATPVLRLAGVDGKDWDLARLRGKVVVVNFWASWCAPCVDELPVLNALARRDPAKVAVVGVNYKEPLDSVERFSTAHPFAYPVLRDRSGDMFKAWTAGVMPTTILVDRQGRARWRSVGEIGAGDTRLQSAIDALLAEQHE
ncbi:redoxin family protein [Massilia sp. LXY-6]|uniref:TlpA family protein disulfide reductase n=1 Tax=Massilia sp. LXY-6 TaxID=3379823 RepID=UPI003EDE9890